MFRVALLLDDRNTNGTKLRIFSQKVELAFRSKKKKEKKREKKRKRKLAGCFSFCPSILSILSLSSSKIYLEVLYHEQHPKSMSGTVGHYSPCAGRVQTLHQCRFLGLHHDLLHLRIQLLKCHSKMWTWYFGNFQIFCESSSPFLENLKNSGNWLPASLKNLMMRFSLMMMFSSSEDLQPVMIQH